MDELKNLKAKVKIYTEVRKNSKLYRDEWTHHLKSDLIGLLEKCCVETGLDASIEVKDDITNLEAVILNLGKIYSGIYEQLDSNMKHEHVRANGLLVYQQLFNGKIMVMIIYPSIEGIGEPAAPKMIAIYRPEELKPPFIIRHLEEFIKEIANWEDYDDDDKPIQKIGFNVNYDMDD